LRQRQEIIRASTDAGVKLAHSTEESFNSCWSSVELIFVKAAARDGYDSIGSQRSSAWMPNIANYFFQLNFLVTILKRLNCHFTESILK